MNIRNQVSIFLGNVCLHDLGNHILLCLLHSLSVYSVLLLVIRHTGNNLVTSQLTKP